MNKLLFVTIDSTFKNKEFLQFFLWNQARFRIGFSLTFECELVSMSAQKKTQLQTESGQRDGPSGNRKA